MPRYDKVLVTGASRGLGAALARELLGRGHRVVMTARSELELSQATQSLRLQYGERVNFIAADLADPTAYPAIQVQVVGPVQVLVEIDRVEVVAIGGADPQAPHAAADLFAVGFHHVVTA